MAKVKLQYKTAEMINPVTKEPYEDKRRPHIVNLRIYNLDELVKFALDNNYIEGAKYELAKGIVKGAIEAERALLMAGNAVSVDGWVKYEPRLKKSVTANKRVLTKDNSLVVGITALKELKIPMDTFSWQLVDEGFTPEPDPEPAPSEPTLTEAFTLEHTDPSDKDKAYGDADLEVIGTNLQGASVNMRFEAVSGAPYDEAVPADKLTIRADGTGFDVDGAWLVANVLAVMNSDDTFQIHAETSAGTADLVVTNKYSA